MGGRTVRMSDLSSVFFKPPAENVQQGGWSRSPIPPLFVCVVSCHVLYTYAELQDGDDDDDINSPNMVSSRLCEYTTRVCRVYSYAMLRIIWTIQNLHL